MTTASTQFTNLDIFLSFAVFGNSCGRRSIVDSEAECGPKNHVHGSRLSYTTSAYMFVPRVNIFWLAQPIANDSEHSSLCNSSSRTKIESEVHPTTASNSSLSHCGLLLGDVFHYSRRHLTIGIPNWQQ